MDFQISTSSLVSLMSHAADIASDKSTMPILSCALLTAEITPEGGKLSVKTYDLELGVSLASSCEIKKAGQIALPAKKLLEVAKAMPSPVTRIKLTANNRVELTSGSASFRLAGQVADDFPAMPEAEDEKYLPTAGLNDALGKVAFAMSHDETRYNLNGVLFDLPAGKLVATDGHRLASSDVFADSLENAVIVSKKAVAKLRKLLGAEGESRGEFAISKTSLLYRRAGLNLVARLIDGSFPDYTQVVPERSKAPVTAERATLRDALSRVMLLSSDKASAVGLSFEEGKLTLTARNPEEGDATDTVSLSGSAALKINVNGQYLMDMLNATGADRVEIHLGDEMSPVLVAPEGDLTHTYVLMPMRG